MNKKSCFKYLIVTLLLISLNSFNTAYSQNMEKLYMKIDLFSEVLEKIKQEYVEEVDQAEVMDAAINGVLRYLDPYSAYMNKEMLITWKLKQKVHLEVLVLKLEWKLELLK